MKKTLELLAVMVLFIVAGSFLMLGCSNPADGAPGIGITGAPGAAVVTGTISPSGLQALVDSGKPIVIAGPTTVSPGYVDLKGASISIEASLTLSAGTVLKTLTANITIGDGGNFLIPAGSMVIITAAEPAWLSKANAASGTTAEDTTLDANGVPVSTKSVIALANWTVSDDAGDVPSNRRFVVYEKLTITEDSVAPDGNISAVGTIEFTGDNDDVLPSANVVFPYATITSTKAVTITTGNPGGINFISFDIASGKDITVKDLTLSATVKGEGVLKLSGAVTQASLGGNGKVEFTESPAFTAASMFGAGLTTFNKDVDSTNAILGFSGPVVFKGDLTRATGGQYSFNSEATFATGKKITLGGTDGVTLGEKASFKVGDDTVLAVWDFDEVSPMPDTVAIVPADGAVLTFEAKKVTVDTAAIAVSGTAGLIVGGELATEVAANTIGVPLILGLEAKLSNNATGTIVLNGAVTLSGNGSWTNGDKAVIVFTTEPDGLGIYSFGEDGEELAEDADGGTLTADGTPVIALAGAGKTLAIGSKTEIALKGVAATAVGTISVGYNTSQNSILFAGPGAKISTAVPNATVKVTAPAGDFAADSGEVGDKLEVYSTAASGAVNLGSITPAANTSEAEFGDGSTAILGPDDNAALVIASTTVTGA
jgi:hypothetical protein